MEVKWFKGNSTEYREFLRAELEALAGTAQSDTEDYSQAIAAIDEGSMPSSAGAGEGGFSAELEQFSRRVIERIPLDKGGRDLLNVFYPEPGVSRDKMYQGMLERRGEPVEDMTRFKEEVRGVVGGLARRINQTPGARGIADKLGIKPADKAGLAIWVDMTPQDGAPHYRLRPAVRKVLKEKGIVSVVVGGMS